MSRARLEFTLPDEALPHRLATDASQLAYAIQSLDQELRTLTKHAPDNDPLTPGLERARKLLHEHLDTALLYILD